MSQRAFTARTYILSLLLFVLAGYVAMHWQRQHKPVVPNSSLDKFVAISLHPEKATNIGILHKVLFRSIDYAQNDNPKLKPGIWQQSEQSRVNTVLSQTKYDYIVLPLEENYRYYDRVTRLMAARWVANAVSDATGKKVMSPELALRALGKRAIQFNDKKVAALARHVGAKVIYMLLQLDVLHSGFARADSFGATNRGQIYAVLTTADGRISKIFRMPFTDDRTKPCEALFAAMASSLASHLVGQVAQTKIQVAAESQAIPALPKYIDDMPAAANSPLANAAYLQLIAMLTPQNRQYERRRLMERSLLALKRVAPTSRYYNVLTARALFYLFRRPAALTYLSDARTPSAKALREYLNGNYPELAALVPKIKDPVLRIMAFLDLKYLGYDYLKTNIGSRIALPVPSPQWLTLVADAGRDGDVWYAPENIPFFGELKGLFPSFDKQLSDGVKGLTTAGAYNPDGPNFDTFQTIFDRAFSSGGNGCCDYYGAELEKSDIWALYYELSVANLLRQLDRDTVVYSDYGSAKSLGAELAPWLMGNPWYMKVYADALNGYAQQVSGSKQIYVLNKALRLATDAIKAAGEVDVDTSKSERLRLNLLSKLSRTADFGTYNASCDWLSCDFPSSLEVASLNHNPIALPYENAEFHLFVDAAQQRTLTNAEMDRVLATRFDGNPIKVAFMADRLINSGHEDKAIAMLQVAAAKKSDNWIVYDVLGKLLLSKGEYAAASRAFMQFPEFSDTPAGQEVAATDRAYGAGRLLFWLGRYKEAMPLYRVAANLNTGANRQFAAMKYYALTESDYRTAIIAAYEQAQRYNSTDGYRDYLTILHLVGQHDKAEAGFNKLYQRSPSVDLWNSMFVGHRMENKSFGSILAWVRTQLPDMNNGDATPYQDVQTKEMVAVYLFEQALIDRDPTLAEIKTIDGIGPLSTAPRWFPVDQNGLQKILNLSSIASELQCDLRSANCRTILTKANPYVHNENAGFLYGYTLLQNRKYLQAVRAFISLNRRKPLIDHGDATYGLPYFAMALAGTHNKQSLAALSSALNVNNPASLDDSFYNNLTRAVIDVGLGHAVKGFNALTAARRHLPIDVGNPDDGWYQLITISQWLYHKTGDARFINKALEWAKEHEVIQPQDSWAYAFEARYAKRTTDRIRAAAFAEYLDPQSAWLSQVPATIRRRARAWWPKHNPFTLEVKRQATKHQVAF